MSCTERIHKWRKRRGHRRMKVWKAADRVSVGSGFARRPSPLFLPWSCYRNVSSLYSSCPPSIRRTSTLCFVFDCFVLDPKQAGFPLWSQARLVSLPLPSTHRLYALSTASQSTLKRRWGESRRCTSPTLARSNSLSSPSYS